ncbi:MAG: Rid family detoxifying hydrolase [Candidatus Hydrogenedentales bacterium]|jgi:2-iminobutanoate/2-iminopropanoate deaminase
MNKQCIHVEGAPPAAGPYSHAVRVGEFLFISGTGPLAADGSGIVHGTVEEESALTLENLKTVLMGVGLDLEHVVKTTVYLSDMRNFQVFNNVYKTYFTENFPARTCVEVESLPLGMRMEIEAIAYYPQGLP